jgi:hypothetical protein
MSEYYVYTIGEDGHIAGRVAITCEDDEGAKRQAELMVDGRAIEVWQMARFIVRLEPR